MIEIYFCQIILLRYYYFKKKKKEEVKCELLMGYSKLNNILLLTKINVPEAMFSRHVNIIEIPVKNHCS